MHFYLKHTPRPIYQLNNYDVPHNESAIISSNEQPGSHEMHD